jgi:hypothetical protein
MDKLKGLSKGGWHPSGDRPIHRESWKSDLKGMATGKKKDPYEEQRNHVSRPLASLQDPDAFGPPPKHTGAYGNASNVVGSTRPEPRGGLGSPVPAPSRRQQQEVEEEVPKPPPEPYRANTTGLRTDNLPKPPVRRADMSAAESPAARTGSPSLPPRQTPSLPARQASQPPPVLPPRMNEHPDEYTPPPPPTYTEATRSSDPAAINQAASSRLAHAGVSVPGFGIGPQAASPQTMSTPQGPDLSELQQRFSRMNAGAQTLAQPLPPRSPVSTSMAAAAKKAPPPPPPKKAGLGIGSRPQSSAGVPEPPPLPLSSKPKPGG